MNGVNRTRLANDRSIDSAYNALAHRWAAAQPQCVPDSNDIFTDSNVVGISEYRRSQPGLIDTNYCKIEQWISPEKLGFSYRAVLERHGDRLRAFHYMPVSKNQPVFIENHPCADSLATLESNGDLNYRRG